MWMPSELTRERVLRAAAKREPAIGSETSIVQCSAPIEWIEAAAEDGKPSLKQFAMLAYTGGSMEVAAYWRPVVIDLAGLVASNDEIPVLLGHNTSQIVGHGKAEITAQRVKLAGVISGGGDAAKEVAASAANGFPWKASVGVVPRSREFVEEGATAKANGKTWKGPINIIRAGVLGEISFVPIAADSKTSVSVAASHKEIHMNKQFREWLEAKGFEPDELTDQQAATLKAAFDGENAPEPPEPPAPPEPPPAPPVDPIAKATADMREALAAEKTRVAKIAEACNGKHPAIEAKAIAEGWTSDRTELEVLRAERPKAPAGHSHSGPDGRHEVIEAAFARSAGLQNAEKHFSGDVLEAADKHYRDGIGLQELLLAHARMGGYDGRQKITPSNVRQVIQAAFSTHSLTTLLTTTGNKILLDGFLSIPQSWRQVAAVRTVSDFKQVTAFRLNASLEYEEVGAAGEIKHGTVSQESYTMEAKTYAKMLALTRKDIINDDLGAFNDLRQRLGLGAAIKMNKVFWTLWLATSDAGAFWADARGNLVTGAALGEAGLAKAIKAFRDMAAPDGNMMNLEPEFILVPTDLEFTARKLYASQEMRDTTANKTVMTTNIYQNKFTPVVVPELGNSAYTGNSPTTWFMLANPSILASAVMCFLNGQQSPTIESADADFNTLGIQFRGYHDFGAAMTEYRASVKATA